MYTEGFEQWIKLNKSITNPLSDWNRTATEIFRKSAQQNLEIIGENFSRWSDQLKRFSNAKKPEELLNIQKDCINENVTATIENVQKIMHTSVENLEEFTKLFTSLREPFSQTLRSSGKVVEKSEKERS